MGKGFYISKPLGVTVVILGVAALATIIALSVVYSQEKAKNNNEVSPPEGGTSTPSITTMEGGTSTPSITTSAPSNYPWDMYRLPNNLVPDHYSVTLWPRLTADETTGLYIFTGKAFCLLNSLLTSGARWLSVIRLLLTNLTTKKKLQQRSAAVLCFLVGQKVALLTWQRQQLAIQQVCPCCACACAKTNPTPQIYKPL